MTAPELAIIPVKPGALNESQSGLNQNWPKIYGAFRIPQGWRGTAAIVCHPTSNFLDHYLLEPLARRGVATMGLNTRYIGSDVTLLMERAIQDLGAGVRWWRERGAERIVLVGNSGGAALAAFYQSQAEYLVVIDTPDGTPVGLTPADLPPVDAIVLCAAHAGRARLLREWLDPSVLEERDPDRHDEALDLFGGTVRPPYDAAFVARFRAAQAARHDRIDAWVRQRLATLRSRPGGPTCEAFVIHRTHADPRMLDLSLDANDRAPGSLWGDAAVVNAAANSMGRFTTLTAFLSQWSPASRADGPARIAETSCPVLFLDYTADQSVFPSTVAAWRAAIESRRWPAVSAFATVKGGNHYLAGQPHLVEEVADRIAGFAAEQA
jgi:pimeloyl-ACP methyl ester carboxylesterase